MQKIIWILFYPVKKRNLQGALVMLGANNLNYGSRLSLRLKNLNNVFILISNELEIALEYKLIADGFDYNYDESYLMDVHINQTNYLMKSAIEILEDL